MINDQIVMPETYTEWRHCIEVIGKIELTPEYLGDRLAILMDNEHPETIKFAELYGEEHLRRTVEWFCRAANEVPEG